MPVDLKVAWDMGHRHDLDWVPMCDEQNGACQMDGAANETCLPLSLCPSPPPPAFTYVQRYNAVTGNDVLGPYINLALNFGWANLMFATNQGPSFPAHQFIYGGTSAPTTNADGAGTYAAENLPGLTGAGCLADQHSLVELIVQGIEGGTQYPCFEHETLGTLFTSQQVTWRYYIPNQGTLAIWNAPMAIQSECGTSNQNGGTARSCPGTEFTGPNPQPNIVTAPKQILTDIQSCQLQNVSWVIPDGKYSDHAGLDTELGPQWVAAIVNAIGTSSCGGSSYWNDTAIVITWDDWGGWYDHEKPPLNHQLGYQLGFRVPLLFVSGYGVNNSNGTCVHSIDGTDILDFGSIANFLEGNFLGKANEGILTFADERAVQRSQPPLNMTEDLSSFYNLGQNACSFTQIPTYDSIQYFITDPSMPVAPDDE